jgi:hypothetical protein
MKRVIKLVLILFLITGLNFWKGGSAYGIAIKTDVGEIRIGGYLENISGVRVGQAGQGKLTMFRSTFHPEFLFELGPKASIFISSRFVKEGSYEMEDEFRDDLGLEPLDDDYYDEDDFEARELYLDLEMTDKLSFRFGKQFNIWGETDVFTLLDVINPQDGSWSPPALMPLEETRIPLWAFRAIYSFTSNTFLECVINPMFDDKENRVSKGGPEGGRWARNSEDRLTGAALFTTLYPGFMQDIMRFGPPRGAPQITTKVPDSGIENGRAGLRLMTTLKGVTYTFAYYYGHNLLPTAYYDGYDSGNIPQWSLRYDRQHILGFSFNYFDDRFTDMVYRGEFALYPNKPYSTTEAWHKNGVDEKDTLSYSLGIDKQVFIPFLNPWSTNTPFTVSAQMFQDVILDNEDGLHQGNYLTGIDKTSTRFTLRINTSYYQIPQIPGVLTPVLTMAYDPAGNGLVMPSIKFEPNWDDRWWVQFTYGNYYGTEHEWLGWWKDQDSLWLQMRFMW